MTTADDWTTWADQFARLASATADAVDQGEHDRAAIGLAALRISLTARVEILRSDQVVWNLSDVLTWLASQGRHIERRTWLAYVYRERAPHPIAEDAWLSSEVRAYHANPGQHWPARTA